MYLSSPRRLRALSQPRFGLILPTEIESRNNQSGQTMFESKIGSTDPSQQGKRKSRPKCQNKPEFSIFRLLFLFAAVATTLTVASHNFHGFKKSALFHKECIEKYGGIWLGQETWLSEKQLTSLSSLGVNFTARSGMEEAVSSGILRGRPFGGVSIAWSSNLDHVIRPLVDFKHHRVVAVELQTTPSPTIVMSIYMPFYNSAKRQECILDTIDAMSMIQSIIEEHPQHNFVIGGDFNTELSDNSPFDPMWREFIAKFDLVLCDQFVTNSVNYTYSHDSLNQTKWNDHFLVSKKISESSTDHIILEDGSNPSDHLPLMMQIQVLLSNAPPRASPSTSHPKLRWDKCTEGQTRQYTQNLDYLIKQIESRLMNCCAVHCQDENCRLSIQHEYDSLICILKEADSILPRFKAGTAKAWWSSELQQMKQKSIEITNLWKNEGRPKSGPINYERLHVRAAYRKAINDSRLSTNQKSWDKLHEDLVNKDTDSFWKSWKKLHNGNRTHCHPVINGISSKEGIAETFKQHFKKHSQPNNPERVSQLNDEFTIKFRDLKNNHSSLCGCHEYSASLQTIVDSIFSMKRGKSCDDDGISAEHFFNAPFSLFQRLQTLINSMLRHGFVPKQFRYGTIVPIVKDHQGNLSDPDNYRGITMSPIVSKILEHTLRMLFSEYLSTSKFQFGFKKNSSTSHAIFSLKETINYYCERGSNVFCSFLDASKAFDRVVHAGLYLKLLSRKVPLIFLNLITYWYNELYCRVRWDDAYSDWFCVIAGVRQGGILSPDFYSVYVDDLMTLLSDLNVGCHIRNTFIAALFYADDMALLSPSLRGLQKLLSACERFCGEWDICLNPKK